MNLSSWLIYVRLRRQDGARVVAAEIFLSIICAAVFTAVWLSIGSPNSFSKDGLIDGLGGLTSVLAGFYVAGLVAIATFFRENSALDDVMVTGPAILNWGSENEEHLTRRQYVCSIFGFLVGLSFFLSISGVISRASAKSVATTVQGQILDVGSHSISVSTALEATCVTLWVCLFVWQILLTLRGLYYLMDRIYDVKPILGKPTEPRVRNLND